MLLRTLLFFGVLLVGWLVGRLYVSILMCCLPYLTLPYLTKAFRSAELGAGKMVEEWDALE